MPVYMDQRRRSAPANPAETESIWRAKLPFRYVGIPMALAFGLLCLTCHIVTGAGMMGLIVVPKSAPTLRETFVPMEAITGSPWIVARSKYPMTCGALQRAGYLETEEQRDKRIHDEVYGDIEREQAKIEADLKRTVPGADPPAAVASSGTGERPTDVEAKRVLEEWQANNKAETKPQEEWRPGSSLRRDTRSEADKDFDRRMAEIDARYPRPR